MSSVKSTQKFGVSGKHKSQVQALAKQPSTYLFTEPLCRLEVRVWNANGTETVLFSQPPHHQYGNVYFFPSGAQVQATIDPATNSNFLFWHGGFGDRTITFNLNRDKQIEAVFSGALFSGDTAFEDFEYFPSGDISSLNFGDNSFFFPEPIILNSRPLGLLDDFETNQSGDINFLYLSINQSSSRDYRYSSFNDGTAFGIVDRFCMDDFESYHSGVIGEFPNTTGLGFYIPTGRGFIVETQAYVDIFDYSSGPKDRFDENRFKIYTSSTIFGSGFISSFIKPLAYGGYENFEGYPAGSITNLTGMQIYFTPLATISGKILPSGG